ncbi:hypothetical protein WJX79_007626 [Trebouxia sp. C0005]
MTKEAIFGKTPPSEATGDKKKESAPQDISKPTGYQITCVSTGQTTHVGNLNAQTVKASKLLQTQKASQPGQEWEPTIRPPWLAEGQGKARRLFEADQGPAKRVIRLARDQTILKLTRAEFKDRLADVLSLLPELPLSALPPKMLSKLVMMPPNNIANQLVMLQGLFRGKQDINELLLKEPTLLTIPYAETAVHFQRLKVLLESPRKKGGQHPYGEVDYDDFVATHPEFLIPENVVMSLRSLCVYLGRALDQDAKIQDYVMGNPGMLLKGYKHLAHAPVLHMSSQDDSCSEWWQ